MGFPPEPATVIFFVKGQPDDALFHHGETAYSNLIVRLKNQLWLSQEHVEALSGAITHGGRYSVAISATRSDLRAAGLLPYTADS